MIMEDRGNRVSRPGSNIRSGSRTASCMLGRVVTVLVMAITEKHIEKISRDLRKSS